MNFGRSAAATGMVFLITASSVCAQGPQVPIPQIASEVPGPALGPMMPAYVQMVGRMAYVWGWPLVYVYNQRTALTKVPEPVILNSVPSCTNESSRHADQLRQSR